MEALPEKWSDNHLFKCNCEAGFKNASCHHVLMASWVVDSSAQIPDRYLSMHAQQRRKCGRPSKKASELGDAGKARCRARLELQAQYKVPQVQKFVFVIAPIHVDIVDHGRLTYDLFFFPHKNRLFPHNVQISPQCTNFPTNCDFPYKGVYFSPHVFIHPASPSGG